MHKLIKKIEIAGYLELLTGLHIGGTNSSLNIGGIDKGVIRNPINNQPYIPGSSLKGKMRALLEISEGTIKPTNMGNVKYHVTDDPKDKAVKLFGNAKGGNDAQQQPSRVMVRDGNLLDPEKLFDKTDMPYTEAKTEVAIDRITSAANPRQIERVPAGARFTLNIVLNVFENENEKEQINNLLYCLKLLRDDYLGGHGSRGYGQINIVVQDILSKSVQGYYDRVDGKPESIKSMYQEQLDNLKHIIAVES